jgi:hypothetical protein
MELNPKPFVSIEKRVIGRFATRQFIDRHSLEAEKVEVTTTAVIPFAISMAHVLSRPHSPLTR